MVYSPQSKSRKICVEGFLYWEPAVKYRGIFINDEWPCMGGWTTEKFGGFNSKMYVYDFEAEDFYIYMMAHMAKHFYKRGCGIRNLVA